jgi:signal transduction histidine kinase
MIEWDADGRPLVLAGTTQDGGARKSLERALEDATRAEQRRLSYDLHDGLGQQLSGIQFMLAGLLKRLRDDRSAHAGELAETLGLVQQSIATTRAIAHGLTPATLKQGGLRTALRELVGEMARIHGIRVELVADRMEFPVLADTAAENLYRMCQEALANARLHGGATEISVQLRRTNTLIELTVRDDGCGIPTPLPDTSGMGLRIMAHRAQLIGAWLLVERCEPRGTQVLIRYPLPAPMAAPSPPPALA